MNRIILNSTTIKNAAALKTQLASANTYFIVEDVLELPLGTTTVGTGSVLDFRGGGFSYTISAETGTDEKQITLGPPTLELPEAKLNLNGATVIAGAYCIFRNVTVSGFRNMEVKAEWFNTGQNENSAQVFINKAIKAAWGCPEGVSNLRIWYTPLFPRSPRMGWMSGDRYFLIFPKYSILEAQNSREKQKYGRIGCISPFFSPFRHY